MPLRVRCCHNMISSLILTCLNDESTVIFGLLVNKFHYEVEHAANHL